MPLAVPIWFKTDHWNAADLHGKSVHIPYLGVGRINARAIKSNDLEVEVSLKERGGTFILCYLTKSEVEQLRVNPLAGSNGEADYILGTGSFS